MRLDQALVHLKLAPSRTKAKQLILEGEVFLEQDGRTTVLSEPSYPVDPALFSCLRVKESPLLRYVSRAGLKLEGALDHLDLSIHGFRCLDVGQSTGGFTEVLVERGAREVIGFDVGQAQLHPKIAKLKQVISFEGINAKYAAEEPRLKMYLGGCELVVGDVSFISTHLIFSSITEFLLPHGKLLFLIKPQFELERSQLNKSGIVTDVANFQKVRARIEEDIHALGLKLVDYFESCIVGQDGNREFFVYAEKPI